MVTRPVLIIGPLSDVVVEWLIHNYQHKYARCEPEFMNCTQEALEKGVMNNILVDFRRRGSQFECYTVSAIKEICDRVSFDCWHNFFFFFKLHLFVYLCYLFFYRINIVF